MNKKYIIRKNEEIEKIIKLNHKYANKYFVIYYNENNLNFNRFCISISKKIGKAYIRNYYKRVMKDILSKNNINTSYDYVIILRNAILDLSYNNIKESILELLRGEKYE